MVSKVSAASSHLRSQQRIGWLFALFVVAAAGVVRLLASLGDFWLDEIVNWFLVLRVDSATQIFTTVKQEANHHLNSLVLYAFGPEAPWTSYRLPAVLAGTATVALAGIIANRTSRVAALTALCLTGSSYLLVHYSSEARGYAYVMFFAALSFWILDSTLRRPRWWLDVLFAVAVIGGILSHLTFLYCYAALGVWSLYRLIRSKKPAKQTIVRLLAWHTAPICFFSWLYVINVRSMQNVGGPHSTLIEALVSTGSLLLGGPIAGPVAIVAACVFAVMCAAGIFVGTRTDADKWIFQVGVILIAPCAFILALGRHEIYPRYFLISAVFALLALSDFLSWLWQQGRIGKMLYGITLVGMIAANGIHIRELLEYGRGGYSRAVAMIVEKSGGTHTIVGSDRDVRDGYHVEFYRLRLRGGSAIDYRPQSQWPATGPKWLIQHRSDRQNDFPPEIFDSRGNAYELVAEFRTAPLSGFDCALYRNRAP